MNEVDWDSVPVYELGPDEWPDWWNHIDDRGPFRMVWNIER